MLAIDFEIEKEGMTVPYPPLFNDIRRNHGFVDLRGRPDLAIEIPEGSQSSALKAILGSRLIKSTIQARLPDK